MKNFPTTVDWKDDDGKFIINENIKRTKEIFKP